MKKNTKIFNTEVIATKKELVEESKKRMKFMTDRMGENDMGRKKQISDQKRLHRERQNGEWKNKQKEAHKSGSRGSGSV